MKTLLTIRKEQVEESYQTTRHGRQLFSIYCRLCTGTFQFLILCTGQCVLLSHGCLLNMQFVFNYQQQQPDLYLKYEIFSERSTSSIIKTNLPRSLLSLVLQHALARCGTWRLPETPSCESLLRSRQSVAFTFGVILINFPVSARMKTVFMVAEKPSLAQSLAKILSNGNMNSRKGMNGACSVHEYTGRFHGETMRMKMTSVCGHVMGADFLGKYNNWDKVDPVVPFSFSVINTFPLLQSLSWGDPMCQLTGH